MTFVLTVTGLTVEKLCMVLKKEEPGKIGRQCFSIKEVNNGNSENLRNI